MCDLDHSAARHSHTNHRRDNISAKHCSSDPHLTIVPDVVRAARLCDLRKLEEHVNLALLWSVSEASEGGDIRVDMEVQRAAAILRKDSEAQTCDTQAQAGHAGAQVSKASRRIKQRGGGHGARR